MNNVYFLRTLEYFVGHNEFDFNTPRSNSKLVINTRIFLLPIYGKDTKVIYRFSPYISEDVCTPYPKEYNPKIIFDGPTELITDLEFTNMNFRIEDDKLIVPRMEFITKLLNTSELSAYYYMYRQQLLSKFINN